MTSWFIIASGPRKGRLHLSGWRLSGIAAWPGARYPNGMAKGIHGVAHCPVCAAMVNNDEFDAYGDLTWEHERWHHESGTFPVPADLLGKGHW